MQHAEALFMKHLHHIIPKHMGGTDDSSNLIKLTIEEHALAHKKLYDLYGKLEDKVAWLALSGQDKKKEFIYERAKLGGEIQGKRNADSGHMARIQKIGNVVEAGRKGGNATISKGKGSFADPEERLKSASKGGKTQGKRNVESGHLKRIAQLPNTRTSGKKWITNGSINKMINVDEIVPDGFRLGKIQKNKSIDS